MRGFALKLVGVPGRKLIRGLEAELTQDFLSSVRLIPFRTQMNSDVRQSAKDGPTKLLPRLIASFGFGRA